MVVDSFDICRDTGAKIATVPSKTDIPRVGGGRTSERRHRWRQLTMRMEDCSRSRRNITLALLQKRMTMYVLDLQGGFNKAGFGSGGGGARIAAEYEPDLPKR
jgi:hypothetical protein